MKEGVINSQQKRLLKERLFNQDPELISFISQKGKEGTIPENLSKYIETHFLKPKPQKPLLSQAPFLEVKTHRGGGTQKIANNTTSHSKPEIGEFMKYLDDLQNNSPTKLTMFDKKQLQKIYKRLMSIVIDSSSPLLKQSPTSLSSNLITLNQLSPEKSTIFGAEDILYLHSTYKEIKSIYGELLRLAQLFAIDNASNQYTLPNIKLLLKLILNVDSFAYISNPNGTGSIQQQSSSLNTPGQQGKKLKTEEDKVLLGKISEIKQSESIISDIKPIKSSEWIFFDSENVISEAQTGYNFSSDTLIDEIHALKNTIVEVQDLDPDSFPTIIAKFTSYDSQYKTFLYKFYNLKNESYELLSLRYRTEDSFSVLKAKIITNQLQLPVFQGQSFSSLGGFVVNTLQLFNSSQENSLQILDLSNLFLCFGKNLLLDVFCEKLKSSFNIDAHIKQVQIKQSKSLGAEDRIKIFSQNALVLEDDYSEILFESDKQDIKLSSDHGLFLFFLEISHYYGKYRAFLLKINQKAFVYKYFLRNSIQTFLEFSKKGELKFMTSPGKSNLFVDRTKLLKERLKVADLFKGNKKFQHEFQEVINFFMQSLEEQEHALLKGYIDEQTELQQIQSRFHKQDSQNLTPQLLPQFQGGSSIVPVNSEDEQQNTGEKGTPLLNPPTQNNSNFANPSHLNLTGNNMSNKSFVSSASKSFRPFKSYVRQSNTWFGVKSVPEGTLYIQSVPSSDQKLVIQGIYMSLQEEFHSDSVTNFESFYQFDDALSSLNLPEYTDPRVKLILKRLYSKVNSITTEEKVQKEYIDTQIELFTSSHRDRLIGSQGSSIQKRLSINDQKPLLKSILTKNIGNKKLPPKSQASSLNQLKSLLHQIPFVSNIDEWDFDVNQLKSVEEKYTISWNILRKSEFSDSFSIPEEVYANFIKELQKGYDKNNNPFHNFNHGISVMQSCFMLSKCKRSVQVLKKMDIFSLILSGLCHDVGHTGRTNNFEIASQSKLALRYHDKSVLEQHHLATTFMIIKKQDIDCNFLQNLDVQTYNAVRRSMISNILFTDIKQHFKLKQDFETYWKTIDFSTQEIDKIPEGELDLLTGMIIHTADFTGAAKPFVLSRQWSEKVNKEFHSQYIEEGTIGIEQTAFMRDLDVLHVMAKAEKGFLNVIVLPLWVSLNDFFQGELQGQISNLNHSIQQWGELSQNPAPPPPQQQEPEKIEENIKQEELSDINHEQVSSQSSLESYKQGESDSPLLRNKASEQEKMNNSNEVIMEMEQEESNERLQIPSSECVLQQQLSP